MPIACPSYYTVRERLRSLLRVSVPQLTNLSLLVFGLFAAGNCQLPRIAAKLPLMTGAASLTQRLRRLLPLSRGGRLYLAGVRLPALPDQPLTLSCGWSNGNKDDEPWYILSDLPADHRVLALYGALSTSRRCSATSRSSASAWKPRTCATPSACRASCFACAWLTSG